MKYLIIALLVFFASFLLGAFINWDINPRTWGDASRFGMVFFGIVSSGITVGIWKTTEEKL